MVANLLKRIDWLLVLFVVILILCGLSVMKSFSPLEGGNAFFNKQIIWAIISLIVFFAFSFIDFRFLKRTDFLIFLFLLLSGILVALFVLGTISRGAKSWFDFGSISFQPVDFMKLVLILILAKYYSRRHVEIKNIKHIFISGIYAFAPFVLVLLQPDFGSAIIIFLIWFGMTLVSGISKKHLLIFLLVGVLIFGLFWFFIFVPYQKARIINFINPTADIHGSGYNVIQSTIAVGSGQIIGKGLGFGTQSRLKFLPEYQTDFVFAAFSEEWGFIGVILVFLLYCLVIWRILSYALVGFSNFETLFAIGVAIFFMSHVFINVGMNLGLVPVTGITLPFISYGGSHLLVEFASLGILMSMKQYAMSAHRDDMKNEFLGI